jgi:type VI secretion system protein ImpA
LGESVVADVDYYPENEPSSPVPLFHQRAQRLVDKDFMAIIFDLTPHAVSRLQVITGKPKERYLST